MARRGMSDAAFLKHIKSDWHSVDALLQGLAKRPASSFLLPHESSQETGRLLRLHYSDHILEIIQTADAACRNEIDLLGQVFKYPEEIDWHSEPVTGWRWPLWHRRRVGQHITSPERPADHILFWELNRHQHLVALGMAYWLTGDKKYVDAFSSQVKSWIERNPLQHGANWFYSLEISIRLIAWTTGFQFVRDAPEFQEQVGNAFLKSLWQQADFLSRHLQTLWSDVTNNHMVAELAGLAIVGAAFPEFREAEKWCDTGMQLLSQQAIKQTFVDGVNKEQATGYHRFVAELLLLIVARNRQGALPHAPDIEATLKGMLKYMLFAQSPTGISPMWGDSDYGRALRLGQHKSFWDFRPILSAGAIIFGQSEWKFAAGRFDEEAFWLLGPDALHAWENLGSNPPDETSQAFPYAGLYVIRDKWASDSDLAQFRCGPFGLGGEHHCAHAHSDLLSFVLWLSGEQLLVDSGTYIYHGPWRDPFRLTPAHNAVMVDGHDQATPMPNFNWTHISHATCMDWAEDRVIGRIGQPDAVEITRELAHPRPGEWHLIDTLVGKDEHFAEWFFHFAPGLELSREDGASRLTVLKEGKPLAALDVPHNGTRIELRSGWYSNRYGVKQENRELYATWQGELNSTGETFFWKISATGNE